MRPILVVCAAALLFGCRSTSNYDSELSESQGSSQNAFGIVKPISSKDDQSPTGDYFVPSIRLPSGKYIQLRRVGIHPAGGLVAVFSGIASETRLESAGSNQFKQLVMLSDGEKSVLDTNNDSHADVAAEMVKLLMDRNALASSEAAAFLTHYCSGVTAEDLQSMLLYRDAWSETCSVVNGNPECRIARGGKSYVLTPVLKKILH